MLFFLQFAWFLLAFLCSSVASTPIELRKRATQVSLNAFTYTNSILAGTIKVQNIAFTKTVVVNYGVGSTWTSSQSLPAKYVSGPDSSGYEQWSFSGTATGATEFYILYTVSGQSYYDPGNFVNYKITSATSSSATTVPSTSGLVTSQASTTSPSTTTIVVSSISSSPPSTGAVSARPIPPFYSASIPSEPAATSPAGCGNFNGGDSCSSGSTYTFPDSAENRRWQTPPQSDPQYVSEFQSYRSLTGYADIQYNSARNAAVVVVNCLSRTQATLTYSFNGASQSGNTFQANTNTRGGLNIVVTGSDGSKLTLDTLYFLWENAAINAQSSFSNGQKGAIVELFGWPYAAVAKECTFVGKAGYMGVKIWPPTEHVWGSHYYEPDNQFRPWYFVYQPVSYKLTSRMGTRAELRSMIQTCRAAGVRVYFDAVINHMSGNGNDIQNHRNSDCSLYSGHNATANSPYFTSAQTYLINPYTGTRPTPEFPAVPYGPTDFHCERSLSSWTDGQVITKGWLVGLTDLNTEKEYVQDRIATYLADVLSLGASGFRVDAAKHIGPSSMALILARLKTKLGGADLPSDFLTWNEVILGGESDLLACGGGEWSWYTNFDSRLSAAGLSSSDVAKVKIWSSDYPKEFPACGRWILPASRFAVQNDDHDQQSPGSSSRDMQDKGSVLVKDKDVAKHRGFEVQLFSRTDADWSVKLVLSSYLFAEGGGNGFPDGLSDCSLYTGTQARSGCAGIARDEAFVENACGYNGGTLVAGKYTRVHRDMAIVNAMRAWVGLGTTTASALGISGCQ
ncbi:glycoside hydrolase superfamily [Dendryphion nanum]|uniref:Alpha-amylase n=1 Tax=Dendryphion nanum TaxID=256645 RepID=A0A9P9CYZ0_9PLEO|nr:glycoside hydrolase superfamily [Dendryphion nanum]